MELEDRIIDVLAEYLGHEPENVKKESRLEEDLGADSLDCVELAMEFEEEFKIPEISDETVKEWKTVQDVIDGIRNLSLDENKE